MGNLQRSFETVDEAFKYLKANNQRNFMVVDMDNPNVPQQLIDFILEHDKAAGPVFVFFEGEVKASVAPESLN